MPVKEDILVNKFETPKIFLQTIQYHTIQYFTDNTKDDSIFKILRLSEPLVHWLNSSVTYGRKIIDQ